MISKIIHITSFKMLQNKINYNEKKVETGAGVLLIDNTFSKNKKERFNSFSDVISNNKNVRSNLAFEISINLPHGENINNETFQSILNYYIKELGYENAPFVAYRHEDKRHKHFHVIVSHIDWEGNKINQYNMFLKAQKISRDLENKYKLIPTAYNTKITTEALNAINSRKYYYQSAIIKGLKGYNTKTELEKNLTAEQITRIENHYKNNTPLSNEQIDVLLGNKKDVIKEYLTEKGLFNVMLKDELYNKVENVFKISADSTAFIKNLQKENIYVRKIFVQGNPQFIYGLKDVSFYINDIKLAKKFTYSNLFENRTNERKINSENSLRTFDLKKQKDFIKRQAIRAISGSKSIKEFSEKLNEKGIELITYQNKGGIYGVGFKSVNIANAEVIKGSDVGLSWNSIEKQISHNSEILIKEIIVSEENEAVNEFVYDNTFYLPPVERIKGEKEEDFLSKKKKKKGKGKEK